MKFMATSSSADDLQNNVTFLIWAATWQNQQTDMCAQRRLRSAWASASVFAVRSMDSLGSKLSSCGQRRLWIRLGGCPGWSESSLGAQAILLVLSWCGPFIVNQQVLLHVSKMFLHYMKEWLTFNSPIIWFILHENEILMLHTRQVSIKITLNINQSKLCAQKMHLSFKIIFQQSNTNH